MTPHERYNPYSIRRYRAKTSRNEELYEDGEGWTAACTQLEYLEKAGQDENLRSTLMKAEVCTVLPTNVQRKLLKEGQFVAK